MFGGLDFKPLLTAGLAPDLDEGALARQFLIISRSGDSPAPTETCVSAGLPLGRRYSLYLVTVFLLANFIGISLGIGQKNLALTSLYPSTPKEKKS